MQSSTASFCCLRDLLCTEAQRLKCCPLTVLYNYIINHVCWYISLTPWIPLRLKSCEWCLCTEVLSVLNLCVRTCLRQKRDLALGQLCFCWAGRAKFLFLAHYETHSCSGTAQIWPQGWGELFSLSCPSSAKKGGLTTAGSACRDPVHEERGLIAVLGWIEPEYSLVYTKGSPAGTAVGQRSTKLPFSVKDPAHQVLYVQLVEGISVKGQDHSYSKL